MTWDNHNEPILLCGMVMFPQKKHMVLVTHKESTFYSKTQWIHKSERPDPVNKGEGSSLMVSDFCSPDLGWLKSKDGWMNLSFSLMRRTLIICVGLKKLVLFSKLAKSWWLLSLCRPLHRLNRPSKFLKTIFPELQWLHLGLTILHDTRKELRMHSQLETCPSFQSFGSQASAKCAMVFFQMGNHKISIMQTTIPQCLVCSKEWRLS